MHKYTFTWVTIAAIILLSSTPWARPCNEAQLAAHKMFGNNGQCFNPDPHPMPYGISYFQGDRIGHCYLYFINSTGKNVTLYTANYDPPEMDRYTDKIGVLSANSYTWLPQMSPSEYEFKFNGNTFTLEDKMAYLQNEGPAIHKYYNIILSNGKLNLRSIGESQAVNLLKNMKYYNSNNLPGKK